MAIAKKLMLLGCYACAASALLLICIAAPAIVSLVNSGKPICMPGLSIRCHESDCGRFFQRCGRIVLLEVPAHKVCYRGGLVSSRRTDRHSCPSTTTIIASNSTQSRSGLGSCSCSGCSCPDRCKCRCQNGAGGLVQCFNPLKIYPSDAAARCCRNTASYKTCTPVSKPPVWQVALEAARQQLAELSQWSPKSATSSFTFQPPLTGSEDCPCIFTGTCATLSC